jgi:hypothetical protein
MDPITFESLARNPDLVRALMAQARRERAEAFHRLVVLPIKRLLSGHAAGARLGHPRKTGGAAA